MFCRHVFGNISGGFRGISGILGNFAGFAEIPEFCGSATTRNIRSPDKWHLLKMSGIMPKYRWSGYHYG